MQYIISHKQHFIIKHSEKILVSLNYKQNSSSDLYFLLLLSMFSPCTLSTLENQTKLIMNEFTPLYLMAKMLKTSV